MWPFPKSQPNESAFVDVLVNVISAGETVSPDIVKFAPGCGGPLSSSPPHPLNKTIKASNVMYKAEFKKLSPLIRE
jgi:hypothetical protein